MMLVYIVEYDKNLIEGLSTKVKMLRSVRTKMVGLYHVNNLNSVDVSSLENQVLYV